MSIYKTIPDAEKTEKENQQSEVICAKKQKHIHRKKFLQCLNKFRKGKLKNDGCDI